MNTDTEAAIREELEEYPLVEWFAEGRSPQWVVAEIKRLREITEEIS